MASIHVDIDEPYGAPHYVISLVLHKTGFSQYALRWGPLFDTMVQPCRWLALSPCDSRVSGDGVDLALFPGAKRGWV